LIEGAGAFGWVYWIKHRSTNRKMALKSIIVESSKIGEVFQEMMIIYKLQSNPEIV